MPCKAKTSSGKTCKNSPVEGGDYCHIKSHQEQANIIGAEWAKNLTDKQRRFVEEYCLDYNATQAAIRAGYSQKTARQQGSRLLSNVDISNAIDSYMSLLSMRSAEAIKRLTDWGRGSALPFLEITPEGSVKIDLSSSEAQQNIHLIKKLRQNETEVISRSNKETQHFERTFEIELHDAKDAVIQISKIRGLYVDRVQHEGSIGGVLVTPQQQDPEEWAKNVVAYQQKVRELTQGGKDGG